MLVVVAVLLAAAAPASASPIAKDRARARAIAHQIGEFDNQLTAIVQGFVSATQKLDTVTREIADNEVELKLAEYRLELARRILSQRAVAMYKEDSVDLVDVILGSSDFNDLIDHVAYLQRLSDYDDKVLADLEQVHQEVLDRRVKLVADREAALRLVAERAAQKARIRAALAERAKTLTRLRGEISRLEAELRKPVIHEQSKTPLPTPSPDPGGPPQDGWWPLIKQAAAENGVDARGMYRLMMIESGGSATVVGYGMFYGLFQYYPATWKASWNPWRKASIVNGAAQIKATALALKMGKGPYWWANSYRWAFGTD